MASETKRAASEPAELTYATLSPGDRLSIARDQLRARESDHFRAVVMGQAVTPGVGLTHPDPAAMRPEIERLQEIVAGLETEVNG